MRNVASMMSKGKEKVTYNMSQSDMESTLYGNCSSVWVVKPERTRRSWSERDIIAGGWKVDNGFRPGHSKMIYNMLKREIPNTELRVSHHINSKIATWKRDYHSLALLRRLEGDLRKDRAAGGRAEKVSDADDVLHGPHASIVDESQPTMSPYHLDDFFTEEQINEGLNYDGQGFDAVVDSETKSIPSPPAPKKALHKRKVEEVMESMLDAMTKMNENTSDRLNALFMRIGYDFDLSAKRVEVAKMLDGIPEITKK
ncbi:hypothetical protein SASPL_154696 [Salvia splendens]|uniref:Myb/SANT-like domain-containing protein n=1 Tax=Salvia splendens TaxID=180675 RepID=A0A8X8W0E7_SALSN|nr:hypothetical protein SASPL_154696 [Salvia splendens]